MAARTNLDHDTATAQDRLLQASGRSRMMDEPMQVWQ